MQLVFSSNNSKWLQRVPPLGLLELHGHRLVLAPLLLYSLRLVSAPRCSPLLSFLLHNVVCRLGAPELGRVWLTLMEGKKHAFIRL